RRRTEILEIIWRCGTRLAGYNAPIRVPAGASSMSQPSLSLAVRLRIDGACKLLEVAWRSGEPRLEDFVDGFQGEERLALARELVLTDQEYRRRRGEDVRPERYVALFPELAGVLQQTEATTAGVPASIGAAPAGRVGDYELLSEIDSGGMGVIYRAL